MILVKDMQKCLFQYTIKHLPAVQKPIDTLL